MEAERAAADIDAFAAAGEPAVELALEAAQEAVIASPAQGSSTVQNRPAARSLSQAAWASSRVAKAPPATR